MDSVCWKKNKSSFRFTSFMDFSSVQSIIYVKMCREERIQHRLFLSELLSKNTGHHAVKQGSDFSFRVPGCICVMRMVSVGLVPRLDSSEPSKRMPEWWCPLCSLKPSSSADRRRHKDTDGGSQLFTVRQSVKRQIWRGRWKLSEKLQVISNQDLLYIASFMRDRAI